MRYTICGLTLDSDLEFPELPPAPAASCDLRFRMAKTPLAAAIEWYHHCDLDGRLWLQFGRVGPDYLLRFPAADFLVTANGALTTCHPRADTHPDTIRHLYLDQVCPLILNQRGKLALHASAIELDGAAVGFAGESGSGKSTLAAALSQTGCRVIADDCLVLELQRDQFLAGPTYGGLRLWPDTVTEIFGPTTDTRPVADYTRKRRVALPFSISDNFVPLHRLYFLELAQQPSSSIEPLLPSTAFIELLKYAFRLDVLDHNRLAAEFPHFARLANSGALRRLRLHHDLAQLPDLRNFILRDAQLSPGSR
ncbi:MAG: hypothetical protein ACE14L_04195 [Terriglobales bacterium]